MTTRSALPYGSGEPGPCRRTWLRLDFLDRQAEPHLSQVRAWYTLGPLTCSIACNVLQDAAECIRSDAQVLYLASTWLDPARYHVKPVPFSEAGTCRM